MQQGGGRLKFALKSPVLLVVALCSMQINRKSALHLVQNRNMCGTIGRVGNGFHSNRLCRFACKITTSVASLVEERL